MFGKIHKETLKYIINNIENNIDKELIDDYITYHTILMSFYARNVFKINSNWIKLKRSYDVNYNYIRENNTSYKFTEIEKEIKQKLIQINQINKINQTNEKNIIEFIDYIRYCMKTCIDDIGIPFRVMSPKIRIIIGKYKNNDYIMNYKQKSTKINYEVFDKMQLILFPPKIL